jgi:hypothetical protein
MTAPSSGPRSKGQQNFHASARFIRCVLTEAWWELAELKRCREFDGRRDQLLALVASAIKRGHVTADNRAFGRASS